MGRHTMPDFSQMNWPSDEEDLNRLTKHLLKSYGEDVIDFLLSNRGLTPGHLLLHAAGNIQLMETLVDRYGADINGFVDCGRYRIQPLCDAAGDGAYSATKWLLERGADVESYMVGMLSGDGSCTALWSACQGGYLRIVHLLLDHGADVNTYKTDSGNTALFIAAQNCRDTLCSALIRRGARVDDVYGKFGSPLFCAIGHVRPSTVALLRSASATVPPPESYQPFLLHAKTTGSTKLDAFGRKVSMDEVLTVERLVSRNGLETLLATVGEHYRKVQAAERKGHYRKALRYIFDTENALQQKIGPPSTSSSMWTQLLLDEKRLAEAVYGVEGSDGKVSVWHRHIFSSTDKQPPGVQFYAWARHGDTIYRHGGLYFMKNERNPRLNVFWAFNIKTKTWKEVETTGTSPGPRSRHFAVVHKNCFYVFGGRSVSGLNDNKIYKLDLKTMRWEAIKGKGSVRPSPREEMNGVIYKDVLYMYGGANGQRYLSEMWSFSFATQKWKLIANGGTCRYAHGMWAAQEKIFILGGANDPPNAGALTGARTIQDFEFFDLNTRNFSPIRCIGDDPWVIMEFTVLPLYHGKEEPSSVIVWGGFCHKFNESINALMEQYGDDFSDVRVPYRRRILKFDMSTMTWTNLRPLNDAETVPTAQSFAAELATDGSVTRIMIGGGYGLSGNSQPGYDTSGVASNVLREMNRQGYNQSQSFTPETHLDMYEVELVDDQVNCFADSPTKGNGWAWGFFDLPAKDRANVDVLYAVDSPSLYLSTRCCVDDFYCDSAEHAEKVPDGDISMLGRQVILKNLMAKPELNGAKCRCGFWLADTGRYQVFVPDREPRGPCTLAVKSSNLSLAPPEKIDSLFADSAMSTSALQISASWVRSGNEAVGQMDALDDCDRENTVIFKDQYRGPLSAKATAALEAATSRTPGGALLLSYFPPPIANKMANEKTTEAMAEKSLVYHKFLRHIRETDKVRVKAFRQALLTSSDHESWGDWFTLHVKIDCISPAPTRIILVSPNITMDRLHQQVLAPAIGWASRGHAYAFRRISKPPRRQEFSDLSESDRTKIVEMRRVAAWKRLKEECWIGPRKSFALDAFFQPLYIGGDMADARDICLGDLWDPDEDGKTYLQFVHDFGDFWSHTITITRGAAYPPPAGETVAYLVDGSGACPPENCGGPHGYCMRIAKLTGEYPIMPGDFLEDEKSDGYDVVLGMQDPSQPMWWRYLNDEVRCKQNCLTLNNPLSFCLETHRTRVAAAIRQLDVEGASVEEMRTRNVATGLDLGRASNYDLAPMPVRKEAQPTDICAVCDITASLKLCSGCREIAFCSREHQLEYWPKHKAACKAAQKRKGKK